jgi:hypothetical protein
MKRVPDLPVEVVAGSQLPALVVRPLAPYSPEAKNFLAALSKRLFANPLSRVHPDVAAFAYWCREANLNRLSRNFESPLRRLGRGLALHITPSNVPVNFAFSLAFGVLSGNANIVRVSTSSHPQVSVICGEISRLFEDSAHARIASMTSVIRYQRNDAITAELSKHCNARILWGGDDTIRNLRSMESSPRCVDICFADRYSLCVLGAAAINAADERTVSELAAGFFNDVFLLDQNACSSPHLVIWQGSEDDTDRAMSRFWQAVEALLSKQPAPPAIHAVEKYSHLCSVAIELKDQIAISRQNNAIYRARVESLPENIENYRGKHGFFFETIDNDFKGLMSVVNERFQTVTFFGINPQSLIDCVIESGSGGIDRVVPVGKALDIGVVWDGYDIIGTLSRVVSQE